MDQPTPTWERTNQPTQNPNCSKFCDISTNKLGNCKANAVNATAKWTNQLGIQTATKPATPTNQHQLDGRQTCNTPTNWETSTETTWNIQATSTAHSTESYGYRQIGERWRTKEVVGGDGDGSGYRVSKDEAPAVGNQIESVTEQIMTNLEQIVDTKVDLMAL